jgi:hypothetical protein
MWPHRLQTVLLLDGGVQVVDVRGCLLGVEGLPRGDLRHEIVVEEALVR